MPERAEYDDKPYISQRMGRTEWRFLWEASRNQGFGQSWPHTLSPSTGGSVSLDWYRSLGGAGCGNLRLHTRVFSGYGESLIDCNLHRTTMSLGLSFLDFGRFYWRRSCSTQFGSMRTGTGDFSSRCVNSKAA